MKRLTAAVLLISLLLITGCVRKSGADETGSGSENITGSSEAGTNQNSEEITGEDDLAALSEAYAVSMTAGEFDEVTDKFTAIMKNQLNSDTLKQSWDVTVADMGSYIEPFKTTEKQEGEYKDIDVILRYENNGLDIRFVYNKSGKIDGLWMNYYPFIEENVANSQLEELDITIGAASDAVDGRLTLPKGVDKPPVVILVQGSGTHDMDETIGAAGNKPFRDIALGLAEQGIASIRYNERFFQYPELGAVTTIEDDLLMDAEAAVKYAASCDKIDSDRIFVLGHSLGGMMAPKIAQDYSEVAGIICLAGSPRRLEDISYDQQMAALDQTAGVNALQKVALTKQLNGIIESIKNLKGTETDIYLGYPASYWYSLNQIDIPEIAYGLQIPILICQGSEDFQVYPDKDYAAWKELLGKRGNVTFRLYENLNHLFMPSNGKKDITEYNPKAIVDQQVIDDMAGWIKQN